MPELMLSREGLTREALEAAVREYDQQALQVALTSSEFGLEAAREIADVEYLRSGREFADNGCVLELTSKDLVTANTHEVVYENYRKANTEGRLEVNWTTEQKLGAFTTFLKTGTENNFTLHRVRMHGDWRRADDGQELADRVAGILKRGGYDVQKINPNDDAAKKIITVDPQQTKQEGYIALRRRRRMLSANRVFTNALNCTVSEEINIIKSSLFALNIEALALDALAAAQEVRLSVIAHMIDSTDKAGLEWRFGASEELNASEFRGSESDIKRGQFALAQLRWARRKMQTYGITFEQVENRMNMPEGYSRLQAYESVHSIEQEIKNQGENGVLIPAATTLWAYRKLKVLNN